GSRFKFEMQWILGPYRGSISEVLILGPRSRCRLDCSSFRFWIVIRVPVPDLEHE
uniref:Uncharacterized protein n=1 Tax=Cannabis sativa TaxID=3483 RepID=A0A803QRC7_CANSA